MADRTGLESFRGNQATLDADREADIRRRLQARLADTNPDTEGQRPFEDWSPVVVLDDRRPRRRAYVAAAAAVLLVLFAGVAISSREGTREVATGSTGAEVTIADLATIARSRVPATLDEGEELYTEITITMPLDESTDPDTASTTRRERWTRPDGTGREEWGAESFNVASPPVQPSEPVSTVQDSPGGFDFGGLTLDELEALPSETQALLDTLRSRAVLGDGSNEQAAWALAELLSLPVTPPAVRAAAFEALGLLGGQISIADSGVEIRGAPTGGGYPWVVAINPATSDVTAFGFDTLDAGEAALWMRVYHGARIIPAT